MSTPAPLLATGRPELARHRATLRGRVAAVFTMGALHDGHVALIRAAAGAADAVIVTIFVNPLQFGPGEDLARYPRNLAGDLRRCAEAGVDLVFAPDIADVYPAGPPQVRIDAGQLGRRLEGAARPGHFDGVLTVVAKLLALTRPDLAVFGEKDAQQLALVRRLVTDLDLPVEIAGVPVVREPDGLAASSRNRYLDPEQRRIAAALPRALAAARTAAGRGAGAVREAAGAVLAGNAGLSVDYLALVDEESFAELPATTTAGTRGRLLVAAWIAGTRLIDNTLIVLGTPDEG